MSKNLSILTNNTANSSSDIISGWKSTIPYHTSIDVKTDNVYNISNGVVIEVVYDKHYIVNVQLSSEYSVRYSHLLSTNVKAGDLVASEDLIGKANKYVSVELCQFSQSSGLFPVYINTLKYYKIDPTDYLLKDAELELGQSTYDQVYGVKHNGQ